MSGAFSRLNILHLHSDKHRQTYHKRGRDNSFSTINKRWWTRIQCSLTVNQLVFQNLLHKGLLYSILGNVGNQYIKALKTYFVSFLHDHAVFCQSSVNRLINMKVSALLINAMTIVVWLVRREISRGFE